MYVRGIDVVMFLVGCPVNVSSSTIAPAGDGVGVACVGLNGARANNEIRPADIRLGCSFSKSEICLTDTTVPFAALIRLTGRSAIVESVCNAVTPSTNCISCIPRDCRAYVIRPGVAKATRETKTRRRTDADLQFVFA